MESVKVVSIALVSVVNSRIGIRPRSIKFELKIETDIVIGLGHYVVYESVEFCYNKNTWHT